MTQEEKSILLKSLCEMLPYKVKVEIISYGQETLKPWVGELSCKDLDCFIHGIAYKSVKPYLRPMSSMTEEEIVEINSMGFAYWTTMINNDLRTRGPMSLLDAIITHHKMVKLIDWLNKHHFDHRGLIEKGLAIEAPNDMYEI